jgi:hypothetical protein
MRVGRERGGGEGGGRGWGRERRNFPLASVCFQAGGDKRKRVHSAKKREGPKARPTVSAPVHRMPMSVGFPFCVRYHHPMYINLSNVR